MYKHLIFDLDDTLLDFKTAEASAIKQVMAEFGIDPNDENVELYSGINLSFWKRFEKGEIEREKIFEGRFIEFAKALKISIDTRKMSQKYFEALSLGGQVFPYTVPLLEYLYKKYTLSAATNGALITQKRRIAASGIGGYFKGGIYISEEIGLQKPQKEYFEYILNALGNPPKNQVLVLGDSLSSDILGANNISVDCCFVNLRGQAVPQKINANFVVNSLEEIPIVCGL